MQHARLFTRKQWSHTLPISQVIIVWAGKITGGLVKQTVISQERGSDQTLGVWAWGQSLQRVFPNKLGDVRFCHDQLLVTQISTLLAGRQSWAYQTSKGRTFNNLGFHQRTKAHWLPRNSHGLTLPILHESTTTAQRNTWTSQTTDAYINYNLSKVNFIESVPGWGHELHLTWKLKTVIFT